jgi:hypothetical protein
MVEPARYAALAARLLGERPPAPESRTSRDVGVSVVAHAMTLRRRRRAMRATAIGVALVVAAGVALWIGFAHRAREGRVAACAGADCLPRVTGAPSGREHGLSLGESLVVPDGQTSTVTLATGTRITLDGGALECRDDSATQRFAVLRGRAHLAVAKLLPGQRFLVETPNAELEVRGTAFSVRIDAATPTCETRTAVEVEEGAVEVRSGGGHFLLHPGERWANACSVVDPAPSSPPVARPVAPAPHERDRDLPSASARAAAVRPAPSSGAATAIPVSSLTQQNDLYARAESASREGRREEALAAYARLLELFPRGPLAEGASVKRARLLAQKDRGAAREEARAYLARYPSGVARSEMEALAAPR